VDWILDRGYSERYGARFLRRQIEKSISYSVARALITQPVVPGSILRVYVQGGARGQIRAVLLPPEADAMVQGARVELSSARKRATLAEIRAELPALRGRVQRVAEVHASPTLRAERDDLLRMLGQPDFWDDPERGQRQMQVLGAISARVELVDGLLRTLVDAEDLSAAIYGATDQGKIAALMRAYNELQTDLERAELDLQFGDAFDPLDAWLTITPGGGGDGAAAPWAVELADMYLGWAKWRGFEAAVVDESVAQGSKTLLRVRLRIAGNGAFALLRDETGAHRLVEGTEDGGRVSRHANVVVWPMVSAEARPLPLADLVFDGGPDGGRGNLIKRLRSRVAVTYRPSGASLECCGDGSLQEIEALALEVLRARLAAEEHLSDPRGSVEGWGDVVRVYHRHREQGARDVRTDTVVKSIRNVLAGRIDPFLTAAMDRRRRLKEGSNV